MALAARRHSMHAGFEEFGGHRSVVVHWCPQTSPIAQVMFVPAFGDEMNQARRMTRLAAEALADRGVASCAFDLHGTGDSSADFGEATVERWLADCLSMIERLRVDPAKPLVLIGCRLGVALAARVTHALSKPVSALIGWAPVLQGKNQLSAMLRAASVARLQRGGSVDQDPKALWAAGKTAAVAGYPISPQLAHGLEMLACTEAPRAVQVVLIDVRMPLGDAPVEPSTTLRERAQAWTLQGTPTRVQAVSGAAFWNVADLVDVPALIERTLDVIETIT